MSITVTLPLDQYNKMLAELAEVKLKNVKLADFVDDMGAVTINFDAAPTYTRFQSLEQACKCVRHIMYGERFK